MKTTNFFKAIAKLMTVLIAVMAVSCEESPETIDDESGSDGDLKGNVVVMDEQVVQYVESCQNDSIIKFSSSIPENLIPRIGSIIYVPQSEKTPYGYLGKIIKVEKTDGYKVFTETAPLDEVFGDLSVGGTIESINAIDEVLDAEGNPIEYEIVDSLYQETGTKVSVKSRAQDFNLKDKLIKFPFDIYNGEAGKKSIKISGEVYAGLRNFSLSIDIHRQNVSYVDLNLTPCVGFNATSTVKLAGDKKEIDDILIGKVTFHATIPTAVGIPLIFPITLYVYGTCGASGEITATLRFQPEYSTNWNVKYENGQWTCDKNDPPARNPWIASEFEVKGEIHCGPKLGVRVGLYNATSGIGIDVIPKYSVGCSVSISSENILNINPLVEQTITISSEAYCVAGLFGKQFAKATFRFPDYVLWNDKMYLLPQYSDFTATGNGVHGEISYKIDQNYFLKFMGFKHGLTIFDSDGTTEIETEYPASSHTDSKGFSYYNYSSRELPENRTFYASPTIFGLNRKFHGEKHEFMTGECPLCPDNKHPHVVDLGLPSGTVWSCCNIDAYAPEQSGHYYGWGETKVWQPNSYSYVIRTNESHYSVTDQYIDIGSDIAGTQYDVAHVIMGGSWKMPTSTQIYELQSLCVWQWYPLNGVEGYLVKGPNGHKIFLPATRQLRDDGGLLFDGNAFGSYWTSNGGSKAIANALLFDPNGVHVTGNNRAMGLSVRPCRK